VASGHGGGGWCAVFVGDGSSHRGRGAERRGGIVSPSQPPLESALVQMGDGTFIERGTTRRHEKLLCF